MHNYFITTRTTMRALRKQLAIAIYNTNDPCLESVISPIPLSPAPKTLLNNIKTLTQAVSHHQLVSLSANQIRMNHRMFAILKEEFIVPGKWKQYERRAEDYEVIVNPELFRDSGIKFKDFEECPSVPGMKFAVWNPIKQTYKFKVPIIRDEEITFKTEERTLRGFNARLWDHEVRHLNGLLVFGENISHGQVFVDDEFRDNPGMHEMAQSMKSDLKLMSEDMLINFFKEGVKEQKMQKEKGIGMKA